VHPERKTVLQIGSATVEEEFFHKLQKHFIEHGLRLTPSALTQIPSEANSACGILIAEMSGKIGFIRSCFETLSDTAEDSGLAFAVLVPTSDGLGVVERLICELRMESRATVSLTEDAGNAAEYLARWTPGPPLGKPTVLPPGFGLPPRTELLLQRSFHDCDRIYLQPLSGGRDASGVFCVHAWLRKSIVGPRPLPFFIKFSTPDKIKGERSNYEDYADFYIPFYLRPNIVPMRCAQVKDLASLVGNFVEGAIPLRAALRACQSPGIIFSLFEISLRGFRSQPASGPTASWDEPLEAFVRERVRAAEVEADTVDLARSSFGLKFTPIEIENRLCAAIGPVKRNFSPYHGDLHTGNIMVRGRDAILIDFSAVKKGPLTADPATLEASLVFGTDAEDDSAEFEEWKKAVDVIYDGVLIHEPPSLGTGPGPFAWLYMALREIRHVLLGCDCKQEEAAEVLAAYLLRFGRLPADKFEDKTLSELARSRRAYALVVAERIVDSLVAKKGTAAT
jgi:hypothetical protein